MATDASTRFDRARAMADPAKYFLWPEEVVDHPELAQDDKILILRRWQAALADESVAEEIGMAGGEPGMLDRILAALDHLESMHGDEPPTRGAGG